MKQIYFSVKKIFLVAFLLLATTTQSKACSYCSQSLGGLDAGSPILTMSPDTLLRNRVAIGYTMQYLDVDQFNAADYAKLNRQGKHGHSYDSQMINTLNLVYGVTDNFNLIASYPYNSKYKLKYTYDGQTYNDFDSIGMGDMTLLAKYRFLQMHEKTISASVLAGIRMPTGQTNERGEGGLLAPDEQPGSGSWDPIMGLLVNKKFDKFSIDLNGIYKMSTPGTKEVIIGDGVSYNLAVSGIVGSREVFKQKLTLGWSMEMNGMWKERVEYQGRKDDSHGGNTILLTPGLRLGINDHLVTSLAVGIPVIENLNGKQPDTNALLFFSMNYVF